jgi:hypothetical protein
MELKVDLRGIEWYRTCSGLAGARCILFIFVYQYIVGEKAEDMEKKK